MTLWKDVTCQSFKPRWREDMFLMLVWFVELLMHLHLIFFYYFFIVLFFYCWEQCVLMHHAVASENIFPETLQF